MLGPFRQAEVRPGRCRVLVRALWRSLRAEPGGQRVSPQPAHDQAARLRLADPHALAAERVGDVLGVVLEGLTAGAGHGLDLGDEAVMIRTQAAHLRMVNRWLASGAAVGSSLIPRVLINLGQAKVPAQPAPP